MVAPPRSRRTQVRQTEPPKPETKPSALDFLGENYLRMQPELIRSKAVDNIFNPIPTITEAFFEGRTPTANEAGLDAGFLAAGFLPVGKAASQLNAIVKKLNKSTDVGDFMTPETMRYATRPNDSREGLFRPGAKSFDYTDVPLPETPYTFGLVPTEKLSPLREFNRMAEAPGRSTGPSNVERLMQHMAEGGKWSDPTFVSYFPENNWGYLAEGNHRLALAELLGLEQLPTSLWRSGGVPVGSAGRNIGKLDTNQLARDPFAEFANSVGNYYVPPTMHPYLLRYFRPDN